MLNSQFAHLAVLAPENFAAVGRAECNSLLFENQYYGVETLTCSSTLNPFHHASNSSV